MTGNALKSFKVFSDEMPEMRVAAARFVVVCDGVCFFDENKVLTARFPLSVSVVSADAERAFPCPQSVAAASEPSPAVEGGAVSLHAVGSAVFEPPPSIGSVTINIAANGKVAPDDVKGLLDELRGRLPEGRRSECLNATLCFVGELASRSQGDDPLADAVALDRLKSAVQTMRHEVQEQYLRR